MAIWFYFFDFFGYFSLRWFVFSPLFLDWDLGSFVLKVLTSLLAEVADFVGEDIEAVIVRTLFWNLKSSLGFKFFV